MNWIIGIWLTYFAMVFALAGCPGSNPEVDWPTIRLDKNSPTSQPVAAQVADMDGNGLRDAVSVWRGPSVLASNMGNVMINLQSPSGTWQTVVVDANPVTEIVTKNTIDNVLTEKKTQRPRYADANAISLADINQDGRTDVLVANGSYITYLQAPTDPADTADKTKWTVTDIITYLITQDSQSLAYTACYDVVAADIDGKNKLDIVAALNDRGQVVWYESPADPTSANGWTPHNIDANYRSQADSLLVVDMDGDGDIDVVSSAPGNASGVISWYEHPADPVNSVWTKHTMSSFSGATRFAFGDLNGDGQIDMAAISPTKRQVAWFPRPAAVTNVWNGWVLKDYTKISGDTRKPLDITIADMDKDGQLDVVVVCNNPAGIFYYSPKSDNEAEWAEGRVAAIAEISYGFFAVNDILGRGLNDVIVPVIHDTDAEQDRIDRFINPGQ